MPILQYISVVKKSKNDQPCSSSVSLPDPRGPLSEKMPPEDIASASASVEKVITESRKQKRLYLYLTDAQRYEVGKRAAENGTTTALQYYAHKFPKLPLTEPTVRRLKDEYREFVKDLPKGKKGEIKEMPRKKKQGRPPLLGKELDRQVQDYIKYLHGQGTAINTRVVMASAEGIVKSKDTTLLKKKDEDRKDGSFGALNKSRAGLLVCWAE